MTVNTSTPYRLSRNNIVLTYHFVNVVVDSMYGFDLICLGVLPLLLHASHLRRCAAVCGVAPALFDTSPALFGAFPVFVWRCAVLCAHLRRSESYAEDHLMGDEACLGL